MFNLNDCDAVLQGFVPRFMVKYRASTESDGSPDKALHCFADLNACWEQLQSQIDDEEMRSRWIHEFCRLYNEVLSNVSNWLDDIQLRLFNSEYEPDAAKALGDIEVMIQNPFLFNFLFTSVQVFCISWSCNWCRLIV